MRLLSISCDQLRDGCNHTKCAKIKLLFGTWSIDGIIDRVELQLSVRIVNSLLYSFLIYIGKRSKLRPEDISNKAPVLFLDVITAWFSIYRSYLRSIKWEEIL